MTYSIYFDETGYGGDVATITGYDNLCRWIDSLDEKAFPLLHELRENGIAHPITEIGDQLETALIDEPPKDQYVEKTASNILDIIDAHLDTDIVLVITDDVEAAESETDYWTEIDD
jgi:hypothetical protein